MCICIRNWSANGEGYWSKVGTNWQTGDTRWALFPVINGVMGPLLGWIFTPVFHFFLPCLGAPPFTPICNDRFWGPPAVWRFVSPGISGCLAVANLSDLSASTYRLELGRGIGGLGLPPVKVVKIALFSSKNYKGNIPSSCGRIGSMYGIFTYILP